VGGRSYGAVAAAETPAAVEAMDSGLSQTQTEGISYYGKVHYALD
jgi:hypothetical protein